MRICSDSVWMAVLLAAVSVTNMNAQQTKTQGDELRLVIVVSRHGIRAPIESETRGNRFNKKQWPTWPVAPGVLTPHGAAVAPDGRVVPRAICECAWSSF